MKQVGVILCAIFCVFLLSVSINPVSSDETGVLPDSFSWRDINGVDYTTLVKNQSPAPTCEAYGLCAALETLMQYELGKIYNPDLSETHLYFYAGGTYRAGYVNLVDAANYLIETGVPDEGVYPDPHRPFDYPFESVEGWENRTMKISEWGWVEQTDESIKSALIEHGPLVFCARLYRDFNFYTGGIYQHTWGSRIGGHVMTLFGYDDTQGCWLIKNSAGTSWGEDGWARVAYDHLFFADWYGEGTGVMYIDGAYGVFEPDVPRVYIEQPSIFTTYVFGNHFSSIIRDSFLQKGAPRILGDIEVSISVSNADRVEVYIDDILQKTFTEAPYKWMLEAEPGLHTLEVHAYNQDVLSKDILDFYKII